MPDTSRSDAVAVADVANVLLKAFRHAENITVTDVPFLRFGKLVVRAHERIFVADAGDKRPNRLAVKANEAITVREGPLNHGSAGQLGPAPKPLVIQPDYWTVGV